MTSESLGGDASDADAKYRDSIDKDRAVGCCCATWALVTFVLFVLVPLLSRR